MSERTEKRPHNFTLVMSLAALAVAFLSAAFSCWQAREAGQARIAAERSAVAAEASVKAFTDSFRFDQRPRLSLAQYEAIRSTDGMAHFSLTVVNNGKTEAFGVERSIYINLDNQRVATGLP